MKFLAMLFFIHGVFSTPAIAGEEVLRVRADNWCPHNCHPRQEMPGYLIEILQAWAKKTKVKLDYKLVPWSRALLDTLAGTNEIIVGVSTADSKGMGLSLPIVEDRTCFFTAYSKWRYRDNSDLATLKSLGMPQDYIWPDPIVEWINANPQKIQTTSGEKPIDANIKKVIGGRVEALVDNADVVKYAVSAMGQDGLLTEAGCLKPLTVHVAFTQKNRKSKKWRKSFDEFVLDIKKTGELDRIVKKYGVKHIVD